MRDMDFKQIIFSFDSKGVMYTHQSIWNFLRESNMAAHIYNVSSHLYFNIPACIDPLIFNEID